MAINDKYQLTNYGSEVQKAIDDALITIPADLALKAYRDEVLTKNQTTPYTPIGNYNPATKLYVDTTNNTTNQRLDAEIARATAAEKVLNEKQVLTYDEASSNFKYMNFVNLNNSTQALIDENALDKKLGDLSLGFFVLYQVTADGTLVEASKTEDGIDPYAVVNTSSELPTTGVPTNSLALVLKNNTSISVYKYSSSWSILSTPAVQNGWLFASTYNSKGYYWFQNTWNLIDMNVDMSQYYKKTEVDSLLTNYVLKTTLGDLTDLTTSVKTTIVGAINSVKSLADTKDTLPTLPGYSLLANMNASAGKPISSVQFSNTAVGNTIAYRRSGGTLAVATATLNDDAVPLKQVQDLINGMDTSGFQTTIPAGTANNIVAYSGTAGTLNTLTRITSIGSTTTDTQIPTATATKTYVDNYKPIIITQGSSTTSTTTGQLTFWIEN